ncbi:uncharacterized protein K02A2.6-like [Aricia agestis]|uniref:uncharacterized protein K02A2.6-like n=1 Tax=Aricia agestis TaxID=91739 RepID=UPI001C207DD5|nr:uncharacterized protein K02A2.6-like [Aricia agestis]
MLRSKTEKRNTSDIERTARECAACRAVRPAPLLSWPWPAEPWSRLNVDYLGPFNNKHTLTAPYHPASNGAAENAVRSVKRALKTAIVDNVDDDTALSRFLFTYRNTVHSTTGRESAVALLGRRLHGRLDLLRPDTEELVRDRQLVSERRRDARPRGVAAGDAVLFRDYSRRNRKWSEGVVLDRESPVSYAVKADDGQVHKRHIDRLVANKRCPSRFSLAKIKAPDVPEVKVEGEDSGDEYEEASASGVRSPPVSKLARNDLDEVLSPPGESEGRTRRQAAL